jgi:hypothetical protein
MQYLHLISEGFSQAHNASGTDQFNGLEPPLTLRLRSALARMRTTATPDLPDLAPDLRLMVARLTTALMVSARADQATKPLPKGHP